MMNAEDIPYDDEQLPLDWTDNGDPGPVDKSVLYDQDKHVSAAIWEGQERGALRCLEHTSMPKSWLLRPEQIELVKKAGFGYLREIHSTALDTKLISALVERWRPETNTFHMPFGEMTVTLEDVAYLLGVPIDANAVTGVTYTTCHAVCDEYLGKAPDLGCSRGGQVKLSWLKNTFSNCPEEASTEVIQQHTRAYLLYLVGSTVFCSTTGNKVPVMYLPLFGNFEACGNYAWGAAALSFLYRALGNASIKSRKCISGSLTLLQSWSYYRLNVGRPKLEQTDARFPFALWWKVKHIGSSSHRDVALYRKALDTMTSSDVEWTPYKNMDLAVAPHNIKDSLVIGRSNTMLICFEKAERHLPGRCLRQFGKYQSIPEQVQKWQRTTRGRHSEALSTKMITQLREWANRVPNIAEVGEVLRDGEYMRWFLKITRRLVGRPTPIATEFQKYSVAMEEIFDAVATLSTDGMNDEQKECVERIRLVAQKCLRDIGSSDSV